MKIIATDFDKTFFTEDYLYNIKLINQIVNDEICFVIVTGRNITHLLKDIKGYHIKYQYLICNDGRVIYDRNLKCLNRFDIKKEVAMGIFNLLKEDNSVLDPIIDTTYELTYSFKSPVNAIIVRPTDREKAQILLNNISKCYSEVTGYISDNWLNIASSASSKGMAVKLLGEKLQCNTDDIYVIGDGINDISLISSFPNSYAVANADIKLKELSKFVVNDFAQFLDKIV
ncbi:MAG: HAD family hydrolase [Bacilli bacterium]|nr:HAD family hydrolase [Bacilli bacterium]